MQVVRVVGIKVPVASEKLEVIEGGKGDGYGAVRAKREIAEVAKMVKIGMQRQGRRKR